MTVTIDVPDNVPYDLQHLALAILRGDESAAMPMVDCLLENWKGKDRITPQYVERLEDLLMDYRRYTMRLLSTPELETIKADHFTLERDARQLGRFGLS